MSYEVCRYIFIGASALCGIMFVISVLLFFLLKVPKLISDLTGRTARKAIKNIREQNEASGDKFHKASPINAARGKLTDKITKSGNLQRKGQSGQFGMDTAKIATQELSYEAQGNETSVLAADETSVLNVAGMPYAAAGETEVLSVPAEERETSLLVPEYVFDNGFCVEFEITYIHTDEIIATEVLR